MARRGIPTGPISWYLREWMATQGVTKQTDMMSKTGWSKATMSQLYNNKQDFSPKILAEAAQALNCETFELLIPPDRAFRMRRYREAALDVVRGEDKARTGTDG